MNNRNKVTTPDFKTLRCFYPEFFSANVFLESADVCRIYKLLNTPNRLP
jgi:hypothetical protein